MGANDKPAVCGSVNDLTASVSALQKTTLTSSAGASALAAVGTNLHTVKADATSQFSPQIAAVEATYSALETSTATAKARPTPASLAATAKDSRPSGPRQDPRRRRPVDLLTRAGRWPRAPRINPKPFTHLGWAERLSLWAGDDPRGRSSMVVDGKVLLTWANAILTHGTRRSAVKIVGTGWAR